MTDAPLVSCLMVTRGTPERMESLEKSVRCFLAQTYPRLELVVVVDSPSPGDRSAVESVLRRQGVPHARVICPDRKTPLGGLRNLSLEQATGEFACQWDDDDLSHPARVKAQMDHQAATGADAVYLSNLLHLFTKDRICYVVAWGRTKLRCHPATLLMRTSSACRYPTAGPQSVKGEDRILLERLVAGSKVAILDAPPYLYVYCFHGNNTWDVKHHQMLVGRTAESSEVVQGQRADVVRAFEEIEHGYRSIDVRGIDGSAFQWSRS